jgi:hypothetical protein
MLCLQKRLKSLQKSFLQFFEALLKYPNKDFSYAGIFLAIICAGIFFYRKQEGEKCQKKKVPGII